MTQTVEKGQNGNGKENDPTPVKIDPTWGKEICDCGNPARYETEIEVVLFDMIRDNDTEYIPTNVPTKYYCTDCVKNMRKETVILMERELRHKISVYIHFLATYKGERKISLIKKDLMNILEG